MTMSPGFTHSARPTQAAYLGARHTRQALWALGLSGALTLFTPVEAAPPGSPASSSVAVATGQPEHARLWMTVGKHRFAVSLANNDAARAFAALQPLSLNMADLNGNEKHADLPKGLAMQAGRPGTIRNGDLMLYGSRTVVVFYKTFDSVYSYTRLGQVDDPDGLVEALGQGNAQIDFSRR